MNTFNLAGLLLVSVFSTIQVSARGGHNGRHDAAVIPESVDWRKEGVITPVRNEGSTGSSAFFGILDAMESLYAIEHGDHLALASFKELAACCGHEAHVMDEVYACITRLGGLCSNITYVSKPGECNSDSCKPQFIFKDVVTVLKGSERALAEAVAGQPVVVAVDASSEAFMTYKGGVLSSGGCSSSPTMLDHSMLAVGYGVTEQGQKYWILKNSWGVSWGESGYLRLAKDKGNMCGVASDATFPHNPK